MRERRVLLGCCVGVVSFACCAIVRARDPNYTQRIPPDEQPSEHSYDARITPDGAYVVFTTTEDLTDVGAPQNIRQVYRWERDSDSFELVSLDDDLEPATSNCYRPSISNDGTLVAFDTAGQLVDTDTNAFYDVYVHDLVTSDTYRVSIGNGGQQPNGNSLYSCIAGGGEFVAFTSSASNLDSDDSNGRADVFRAYTLPDGGHFTPEVVSWDNETPANQSTYDDFTTGDSTFVGRVISDDGDRIVFYGAPCDWDDAVGCSSGGSDCLCPQPDNDCESCLDYEEEEIPQVYLRDLGATTPYTIRVSRLWDETNEIYEPGNATSRRPALSGDGDTVAFCSSASNFVGDSDGYEDIFCYDAAIEDIVNEEINAYCVTNFTGAGNGSSTGPALSHDGNFLSFESYRTGLVSGDTNGKRDVFVADFGDPGEEILIFRYSVDSENTQANDHSSRADIAAVYDPTFQTITSIHVVYQSSATNLISSDTNGKQDIFETQSRAFRRGDADGDGSVVSQEDGNYIFQHLFNGGPAPPCEDAADADDNGVVNLTDVYNIDQNSLCLLDLTDTADTLTCLEYTCQ
jgi:hypothetical protein